MSARWPARPTLSADFYKAHGLGNDYLVFEAGRDWLATEERSRRVCDRTRGIGSDGFVVLCTQTEPGRFPLRMFNPDGSEFERSGNGLRILASYLFRTGRVSLGTPFPVDVGGGEVAMVVHAEADGVYDVSVEMGSAIVGPAGVGLEREVLTSNGVEGPGGGAVDVVPVHVGNPHLVVLGQGLDDDTFHTLGPFLSKHSALSEGANVQIAEPAGPGRMRIRIWERGVGPTSASGTSACAVAVAAVHRGIQPPGSVVIESDGGVLDVTVTAELEVTLRGPVEAVGTGRLAPNLMGLDD